MEEADLLALSIMVYIEIFLNGGQIAMVELDEKSWFFRFNVHKPRLWQALRLKVQRETVQNTQYPIKPPRLKQDVWYDKREVKGGFKYNIKGWDDGEGVTWPHGETSKRDHSYLCKVTNLANLWTPASLKH